MSRPNILLVMSDEHDPAVTGCHGHPCVRTPNLDRLASESLVFDNAYTNCPICVPARMAFLTGQYTHRIRSWDNSSVLSSGIPTFGTHLEKAGYDTYLCGRTHINGTDRLHGFGTRLLDDIPKWINHPTPPRTAEWRRGSNSHVTECGPDCEPAWLEYDREAADRTVRFLEERAEKGSDRPWLIYAGFMYPHFPLYCPREYFDHYYPDNVVLPQTLNEPMEGQYPVVRQMRYGFQNDAPLPEDLVRRALASYYGLIELTDMHIGMMLEAIDNSSLRDNTAVIYTSDHGEMAGQHGVWQKQLFYEAATRVPLMVRVPEETGKMPVPRGSGAGVSPAAHGRVSENVSLIDIAPTLTALAGAEKPAEMPGADLLSRRRGSPRVPNGTARGRAAPVPATDGDGRAVFSEYHAQGMLNGGFMIRKGDWKYCYYVGHSPRLFNVAEDPDEVDDLGADSAHTGIREEMHRELLSVCDPDEVDRLAKSDQGRSRSTVR